MGGFCSSDGCDLWGGWVCERGEGLPCSLCGVSHTLKHGVRFLAEPGVDKMPLSVSMAQRVSLRLNAPGVNSKTCLKPLEAKPFLTAPLLTD